MKRTIFSILACLFFVASCSDKSATSCGGGDKPVPPQKPTSQWRCDVNGKPWVLIGAQLRMDLFRQLEGKRLNELDDYFRLAASLNINTVQASISWSDIETSYDVYSDEVVKAFIDYCDKYSLKLELLWFGSFMCGYSVEGHLPAYVVKNKNTYARLTDWSWQSYQGEQFWLSPNGTSTVTREAKAIGKMMDFIYEYDKKQGGKHTVIGIQVENEPNMIATRQCKDHGGNKALVWRSLLAHLDKVGQAVKNSNYNCYTRVNMTPNTSGDYKDFDTLEECFSWCRQVCELDGIDYVGVDPYETSLAALETKMKGLQAISGNYAHVAENGGEYENNDLMTLKALTMGAGYEIFEVVTTKAEELKYPEDFTIRGLYTPDFVKKSHAQKVIDANAIMKNGWYDFATASVANMIGFNLEADFGKTSTDETRYLANGSISWSTSQRGVAYAVLKDNHITVASTKSDSMTFGFDVRSVESGYFNNDGEWIRQSDKSSRLNGKTLSMEAGIVYRITL